MIQFVVKPFLDEISKMKFREKVMGELVGIVPRKLDVFTLLDVVRKYADIKDEEALKREFAAALNPETEEEKSDNVSTKFQIGLKDVLVEETVQVLDHVLPWEDAIQTVAKPLLDEGISQRGMLNFQYFTPTKVVFGKDAELKVGPLVKEEGCKKVLVHYGGQSAKKSGLLDRVCEALKDFDIDYVTLGGVVPNPHLSKVYEGS